MPLKVSVSWPNGGSALLPETGANITLSADGTAQSPIQSATGRRVFSVPDGTSQLKLAASFVASFGPVSGPTPKPQSSISAPPMSAEVLRAEQTYSVVGGSALSAQAIGDFAGPHPLLVTKGAAGRNGAVAITVRTEFVDVGAFWPQYCANWGYYLSQHHPGTTTVVLGHTGGTPVVWFASVSDGCASFSNGFTSCLVFYRPNNYPYSRLDVPHQAAAIARYFLEPKPDSDGGAQFWERDHANASDGYHLMRCRFEDSIVQSRRALVMLHPWPSETSYGVATSAGLPTLCERAVRFLWAKKMLCKGVGGVGLGRLGLSAFSRGGDALWTALRNNVRRVREVYAFDCTGTGDAAANIIQWFNSHDTNILRLASGAFNFSNHASIARTINPSLAPRQDLTVVPPSAAEYDPSNNTVWEHFIGTAPFLRTDSDARHQFAICGGQMLSGKTQPYDLDFVETYLLNFLRASGFQHI